MGTIEKYWPFALSLLSAIFFYFFQHEITEVSKIITNLLSITLSLGGTLLGFLLTILTIINTINTRRMKFVKDGGAFPQLNRLLKVALWLDLIGVLLSFVFPVFLSFSKKVNIIEWGYVFVIFIVSYMIFANIRFITIFISLLTDPEKD